MATLVHYTYTVPLLGLGDWSAFLERVFPIVYLAWLHSSTRELQWLQYLKSVFLETPNVTTLLVFQNQVTFITS